MRILVVEPDPALLASLDLKLRAEHFNVYTTDSGEEAAELGQIYDYDVLLTELALPDLGGFDLIRTLRKKGVQTPILALLGYSDPEEEIRALGFGADDVVVKPFSADLLVARLVALVRRAKGFAQSDISIGDLTVHLATREASLAGGPLYLTRKEYDLLEVLALRRGSTVTKETVLNHLYGGMDEPEMKVVDVFVCKLRKKLGSASATVETVWGRGYVLRERGKQLAEAPAAA